MFRKDVEMHPIDFVDLFVKAILGVGLLYGCLGILAIGSKIQAKNKERDSYR